MKLFSDRHSWFDHEMHNHRSGWKCQLCSDRVLATKSKLESHIRHHHEHSYTSDQLLALLEAGKQPASKMFAFDCPFCNWDETLRRLNDSMPQNYEIVVTPTPFRHHLGSHTEQLALFALPRSYKEMMMWIPINLPLRQTPRTAPVNFSREKPFLGARNRIERQFKIHRFRIRMRSTLKSLVTSLKKAHCLLKWRHKSKSNHWIHGLRHLSR